MRWWLAVVAFLIPLASFAQPTVAPTAETVGTARGDDWLGYNIRQSFEVGVRFLDVDGSREKYRSDVNYRNGLRLLSSRLEVHSKEGRGRFFDDLVLTTMGLGNDPYENAALKIEKNNLYRYDFSWRLADYYNPALALVNGNHALDTTRTLQNHDFTLFPTGKFRLFAGYSRNTQTGTGLTTVNLFEGHLGSVFPIASNIRRLQNEYRAGFEVQFAGFRFIGVRNWEFFKDDSTAFTDSPVPPDRPAGPTALDSYYRAQPYHGSSPGWRAHLFTEKQRWFAVNGRFTWVDGRRNFIVDETAVGTSRFFGAQNRQILVGGDAQRPVLSANGTVSVFPGERWTLSNHTSFTQNRINGNAQYTEFDNQSFGFSNVFLRMFAVRMITNTTDAQYQATRWLSFHGGFHYADRRIRSQTEDDPTLIEQSNQLKAGQFGIRLRGLKGFSANFDGELGRSTAPFYPTSDRNYNSLNARVEYKHKRLRLMAQARSNYTFNFANLWSYSAKSRQYGIDGSWAITSWMSFDAGYNKLHLDTLSGLQYFQDSALTTDQSWYVSNLHSIHAGLQVNIKNRADVYAGWTRLSDQGGSRLATALPYLQTVQAFPFLYHSPMVRLSIPITRKIRWNAGYQFYGYGEAALPSQNYQANTAFTSLLWAF